MIYYSVAHKLAASYARCATTEPERIEAQHAQNRARAEANGYHVPPEYCFSDDGVSGQSTRRPGLDGLLSLVLAGDTPLDRLYITDRTRLGRWSDPRHGIHLSALFEQHGVEIRSSEQEEHVDYSGDLTPQTVSHYLREVLDGIVSSEERMRSIRRSMQGRRYLARRGFWPGAHVPYATTRWIVEASTGALVRPAPAHSGRRVGERYRLAWAENGSVEMIRTLFRWLEEGLGLAACARRMTADGITPPAPARAWSGRVVAGLVRNPLYCGDLV